MVDVTNVRVDEHRIAAPDDTLLCATVYSPANPSACNDRVVLIAPALGATQQFYAPYARFLAQVGFAVLTFDYRGVGASRQGESLRQDKTTLQDWGTKDLQAALYWMERQYPANKIFVVGHSIGGSLIGLAQDVGNVEGIMGVGAQTTHPRCWPIHLRLPLWLMWYLVIPLSSRIAGYFPAGLFGMGEPLPRGVGLEWAQLGRTQDHFRGIIPPSRNHFNAFSGALALFSFSDDRQAPRRAVDDLANHYPNATLTLRQHIDKRELGAAQIGHTGFFREEFNDTLWQESLAWLVDPHREPAVQPQPAPGA